MQREPLVRVQAKPFVGKRILKPLERFLQVEAASGIVLLAAAVLALAWANSPWGELYRHLWHTEVFIGFGAFSFVRSLHFSINEGLMTIFFLLVGLEIRREMHEGALASLKLAALPVAAALGGILMPALLYLALNPGPPLSQGWAVPTATDIAFAVGVLTLLGRRVPAGLRALLLALAIIDDIAAILIIAFFYADGVNFWGLVVAAAGVGGVFLLQRLGAATALPYVLPGLVVWFGMLVAGVHPTLAGVVLGLLTPVAFTRGREAPLSQAEEALDEFRDRLPEAGSDPRRLVPSAMKLKDAQRELLPPVVRVEIALHPWVAYGIMPLFALANAGVDLAGLDFSDTAALSLGGGIALGLLVGKPLGIVAAAWAAVRLGLCVLPSDVDWRGMLLVGCLGGIGFTMSIFIATLAFPGAAVLESAKFAVLLGSLGAAVAGLALGWSAAPART